MLEGCFRRSGRSASSCRRRRRRARCSASMRFGLAFFSSEWREWSDRLLAAVDCRLEQEEIERDEDAGDDREPENRGSKAAEEAEQECHSARADYPGIRGKGHREADSTALADLVPDGSGEAGIGPRDQARGRGLQRHERRRLRAALLRGPRRAGEPRHPARGGEARRGVLRGRALLAAAGELLPRRDLLLRRRAGGAVDRAAAADRRRLRLRRAAAARPAAGRLGSSQPARPRARRAPRSRWR